MKLVNLTPHPIVLRPPEGEDVTVPPSGIVARVSSVPGKAFAYPGGISPVPIHELPAWGEIIGLPEPDGSIFIVSAMVAARCNDRRDVVFPATGPQDQAIRDGEGRIIAVTRLIAAFRW
jgi:hypothetical protein